jgi:hypothetical protein
MSLPKVYQVLPNKTLHYPRNMLSVPQAISFHLCYMCYDAIHALAELEMGKGNLWIFCFKRYTSLILMALSN